MAPPDWSWANFIGVQLLQETEIAFGDQFIAVPPQTKRFEHTVKMSQDGYDFEVQIEAGIRLDTGEVYARFQSLNPTNGLPPPVDIGMLPPEDGTGRGMGQPRRPPRAVPLPPTTDHHPGRRAGPCA